MSLRATFLFLSLFAFAAPAAQGGLCSSVSAHARDASPWDWHEIPKLARSPLEWDGTQVAATVSQLSPQLDSVEARALLIKIHEQGHRILFIPELGESAWVLIPGHPYLEYLESVGYTPPPSGHWLVIGKNCDYFTLFHESVHLTDIPLLEAATADVERVLKNGSSGATEVYLDSAGLVLMRLIFEQRANTLEMQEVRRREIDEAKVRRRELLADMRVRELVPTATAKLDFLKEDSTSIYEEVRALMRKYALPGEFSPEKLFPGHF